MLQGKQLKMFPTSLPFHGSAVKSSAIQHTYKNSISFTLNYVRIQCFDAVGWAAGRASGL